MNGEETVRAVHNALVATDLPTCKRILGELLVLAKPHYDPIRGWGRVVSKLDQRVEQEAASSEQGAQDAARVYQFVLMTYLNPNGDVLRNISNTLLKALGFPEMTEAAARWLSEWRLTYYTSVMPIIHQVRTTASNDCIADAMHLHIDAIEYHNQHVSAREGLSLMQLDIDGPNAEQYRDVLAEVGIELPDPPSESDE